MSHHDAIVIGAGQSGLAIARALRTAGLAPVVLEAGDDTAGSWPHYYDSLTLFSPARYSALPGLAFSGDPDRYPHRDDVVAYLRDYAARLDADIRTRRRVHEVTATDGGYRVQTTDETLTAPLVVAASGGFGNPHRPALPGLDAFTGEVLHASAYRAPQRFAGQHVVVVGAGNSAVQVATELAGHARVTLASRAPLSLVPQRPLGRDVHFWSTALGLDHLPVGPLLRHPPRAPVLDDGRYRAALTAGHPRTAPVFAEVDGTRVTWPDGCTEHVDTIVLATGYRPDLPYLHQLGTLDPSGTPRQLRGLSLTHPGLGFVGLEWQRSLASATLRGVGRDATYLVGRLLARVRPVASRCCPTRTT